jgi:two-component system, OmpR family, sensor histidine kinase VicK
LQKPASGESAVNVNATEMTWGDVLLSGMTEGVILLDVHGNILQINHAAERLFKLVPQSLPQNTHGHTNGTNMLRLIAQLHRSQSANVDTLVKTVRELLATLKKYPSGVSDFTFQIGEIGEVREIEASVLPVPNSVGVVDRRLVLLRDVTERKEMKHFRDELIPTIAHDLRSPLTAMVSSLQLMQDMIATGEFNDLEMVLNVALAGGEDQMRLLETILEVARLERGGVVFNLQVEQLSLVVERAINLVNPSILQESGIQIVNLLPKKLPLVQIDKLLMQQVLGHLLDNALRFTPDGGEVRFLAEVDGDRRSLRVGIVDTGDGVPVELRKRVFAKFFQHSRAVKRGRRGRGLGLYFCKLVIEAQSGQIWIENGPKDGAVVWFTLPLADPDGANTA